MEVCSVESFTQLHDKIKCHHNEWRSWYYRGHSNANYKLVPKAGRERNSSGIVNDRRMFEIWKLHAVAFLSPATNERSEWDLLATAQHHGLVTRLLDWTFNPLNAAFFAVVRADGTIDQTTDAAIYAHYSTRPVVDTSDKNKGPFKSKGIRRIAPSSVTPRI